MEAFLVSALAVGIAEIGDRSLFLAILFGVRYRRPWPIFWGMALGLSLNQALSALFGVWLFSVLPHGWHGWLIGGLFLIMAIWVLIPEDDAAPQARSGRSLVLIAAVAFFLLEMADKTQLAVITLAGAFDRYLPVVLGATVGILMVTTPALWLGHRFAALLPVRSLKRIASALFLLLAVWVLLDAAGLLPDLGLPDLLRGTTSASRAA